MPSGHGAPPSPTWEKEQRAMQIEREQDKALAERAAALPGVHPPSGITAHIMGATCVLAPYYRRAQIGSQRRLNLKQRARQHIAESMSCLMQALLGRRLLVLEGGAARPRWP